MSAAQQFPKTETASLHILLGYIFYVNGEKPLSFVSKLSHDQHGWYSHETACIHSCSPPPSLLQLWYPASVFSFSTWQALVMASWNQRMVWVGRDQLRVPSREPFLQQALAPTSPSFFRCETLWLGDYLGCSGHEARLQDEFHAQNILQLPSQRQMWCVWEHLPYCSKPTSPMGPLGTISYP